MRHLPKDLDSDAFVRALLAEARKAAELVTDAELATLREKMPDLNRKFGRATEMVMEAQHPRPWLEKIEEMAKERAGIAEQLDRSECDMRAAEEMRGHARI